MSQCFQEDTPGSHQSHLWSTLTALFCIFLQCASVKRALSFELIHVLLFKSCVAGPSAHAAYDSGGYLYGVFNAFGVDQGFAHTVVKSALSGLICFFIAHTN